MRGTPFLCLSMISHAKEFFDHTLMKHKNPASPSETQDFSDYFYLAKG